MKNNKYLIYECNASRIDKSSINRIIKIQSHFQMEDLAMALCACSDRDSIKEILIENGDLEIAIDHRNLIYEGLTFDEAEELNMNVAICYQNRKIISYSCKVVGEEVCSKPITKKIPILLSAMGYSMYTKEEYIDSHMKIVSPVNLMKYSDQYASEELRMQEEAFKKLHQLFTLFKEEYYA